MWVQRFQAGYPADPHPELRVILKPGLSPLARALISPAQRGSIREFGVPEFSAALGVVGALTAMCVLLVVGGSIPVVLGLLLGGGAAAATAKAAFDAHDSWFGYPTFSIGRGTAAVDVLALIADTDHRFAFAERKVRELPTGIDWDAIAHDVDVLRWECVEHAAEVAALDVELSDLNFAEDGTAAATLRDDLRRARADHVTAIRSVQRGADALARTAGAAAAAAQAALRSGSVHDLRIVSPTGPQLQARATVVAAIERLHALTAAWDELAGPGQPELPTGPT